MRVGHRRCGAVPQGDNRRCVGSFADLSGLDAGFLGRPDRARSYRHLRDRVRRASRPPTFTGTIGHDQLQPCRLPVPSHPSCPCAAVRAGGQPLAQGVRADPRRGQQQAGWQQGGMGWADAVGGKGRLIFLSSQTSRGGPVSPGSSGLRATFLLRFRRVVALQVGGSMAKRKNTSILVLVSAPRPGCARGRSALQSALEQGRERRRAISLGLDTP